MHKSRDPVQVRFRFGEDPSRVATPRVLVVDDEVPVAEALVAALQDQQIEARGVHDGVGALACARTFQPHLVLLDVMLPGLDGMEVARRLRTQGELAVIFVTARDEPAQRLEGFAVGGDDYVTKPFLIEEVIARVRAVLRRVGHGLDPLRIGDLVIDADGGTAWRGDRALELSATELRLLAFLAGSRGRVMSKNQILTQVWGYAAYDPNLVEVFISGLRRKLEAEGEPRVIHTVRGLGYRLRVDPPQSGR